METSLKLQMDVKNNAQELQNYMLDMKNWEEEMKKKELSLNDEKPSESNMPPPRNKIKRTNPSVNFSQKNKISAYDYSAWDKFDVEKACAEIDREINDEKEPEEKQPDNEKSSEDEVEDTNLSQNNLNSVDVAFYNKELGNQFVKKEQWNDAIRCYTNAISIDSKNAVYYANRSLCFLKLKDFKSAEVDSTVAIQLDKNYVKAYQRRAFARVALRQLAEAKSDFEEVLRVEPKNLLATLEINKIKEKINEKSKNTKEVSGRPTFNSKNIFKSEEKKPQTKKDTFVSKAKPIIHNKVSEKKKNEAQDKTSDAQEFNVKQKLSMNKEEEKSQNWSIRDKKILQNLPKVNSEVFKPLPEWCSLVQPISIPPHKRSKKPLKRINIVQVDSDEEIDSHTKSECSSEMGGGDKKKVEHLENEKDFLHKSELLLGVPKTSVQFQNCWKVVKQNPKEAYSYLKQIPGSKLPQIFENSLESDFFSELVAFIASDKIKKEPDIVFDFLLGLSNVKRFSSMILFMSGHERACLKKCIAELEQFKSQQEISKLIKLYEL